MRGIGVGGAGRARQWVMTAVSVMAIGLVAVPVAEAAKQKTMKLARFTLTLTGTQTTDWKIDQTRYDGCVNGDVHTAGSGRERLTFGTARPGQLQAIGIGRDVVLSSGARGIPARGTIHRQGNIHLNQLSGGESWCGGVPEPTLSPAADCGTRHWSGYLIPVHYGPFDAPVENPILQFAPILAFTGPALPGGRSPSELFVNCPGSDAMLHPTDTAELKPRDLFSGKRRIVVRGEETFKRSDDGYSETVTIRWRAVLKLRGAVKAITDRRLSTRPGQPSRPVETRRSK